MAICRERAVLLTFRLRCVILGVYVGLGQDVDSIVSVPDYRLFVALHHLACIQVTSTTASSLRLGIRFIVAALLFLQ